MMSELAAGKAKTGEIEVTDEQVAGIERRMTVIRELCALPEMFVVSATANAATLDVARTVIRRAERASWPGCSTKEGSSITAPCFVTSTGPATWRLCWRGTRRSSTGFPTSRSAHGTWLELRRRHRRRLLRRAGYGDDNIKGSVALIEKGEVGDGQTSACATTLDVVQKLGTEGAIEEIQDEGVLHTRRRTVRFPLPYRFCTFDYRTFCRLLLDRFDGDLITAAATRCRQRCCCHRQPHRRGAPARRRDQLARHPGVQS